MLRFNRRTEYGLMALKHLAQVGRDEPVSARDVADRHQIPYPLLAKIMHQLVASGFVESHQGSNGGYTLARDLASVNVADVVTALEGPWATIDCADETAEPCTMLNGCTIIDPMTRLNGQIMAFLKGVSVNEIIGPQGAHVS